MKVDALNNIVADLRWRGLIHQTTEEEPALARWLLERPRTLYAGFDPTAESLHVGSLLPLLLLRRFQKAGHRPIAVVGGATGMIGDPSGKSEERKLLSVESLRANVAGIETQMRRFLDFDAGPTQAMLVNNYDWISRFGYIEFLRDIGKNFPVNVMLAKESVRARLDREDAGMSYTEFSYMLLQAYDFVSFERASRLRAANRRQRSMGQHHRGHRPCPTDARRAALRHDLPAVDQERRRARWVRPRVARSGSRLRAPALTSSTSTGSTLTTPMPASACGS